MQSHYDYNQDCLYFRLQVAEPKWRFLRLVLTDSVRLLTAERKSYIDYCMNTVTKEMMNKSERKNISNTSLKLILIQHQNEKKISMTKKIMPGIEPGSREDWPIRQRQILELQNLTCSHYTTWSYILYTKIPIYIIYNYPELTCREQSHINQSCEQGFK